MMAFYQTGANKLSQNAVNRGKTDIFITLQQGLVDIFSGHMPGTGSLKNFENFYPWQRDFQASFSDISIFHTNLRYSSACNIAADSLSCGLSWAGPNNNHPRMQKLLISVTVSASVLLGGCSSLSEGDFVTDALDKAPLIYRPTIQQGNVITQQQVDQLEPGMSKNQVRFVLGSPTLVDTFHDDRWDYMFTQGEGSTPTEFNYFRVYFADGKLTRIAGDMHPTPSAEKEPPKAPPVVSVPDWEPPEKTFFQRIQKTVGLEGEEE